jgi:hypothetical protein
LADFVDLFLEVLIVSVDLVEHRLIEGEALNGLNAVVYDLVAFLDLGKES